MPRPAEADSKWESLEQEWGDMLRDMSRFRRVIPIAVGYVLLSACDGDPIGPTVRLDTAFVLTVGETATLQVRSAEIRFVGVTGDSRCPIDVVCVTSGDAVVEIAVKSSYGPEGHHELHTGDLRSVQHGTLTMALLRLEPDPVSTQTIPPKDYQATLRVTE